MAGEEDGLDWGETVLTENLFRLLLACLIVPGFAAGIYHRRKAAASGEKLNRREEGLPMLISLRLFGIAF